MAIIAITRSNPMTITVQIENPTTQANTYIVGMAVRLFVPYTYGMFQAHYLIGTIKAINGNTWTLNIDSSQFDPFVIPASGEQPATIAPNGSINLEYNNDTGKVPFQSYNNSGN